MADTFYVNGVVRLVFKTYDSDGDAANATSATLAIVKPDGTNVTPAPTLVNTTVGEYSYDYTPTTSGWFQAKFTATGVNAGALEDNFYVQPDSLNRVLLADVKTYLGDTSWSDAQIQSALDAERVSQVRSCRVDDYGPDLREALFRRVARNLAARSVPVASFSSFEGAGTVTRVPMKDPEIVRLEAPYRRLVVG